MQWTAGLYYAHVNENSTEYVNSADIAGATPANAYLQPIYGIVDKQAALFGEVSYKLTDTFKATVGLRYSKLSYDGQINESGALVGNTTISSSNSGSANPVTPRFVLNYQPDSDSLYYVSASKGFRPGGINATLPTACTGLPCAAGDLLPGLAVAVRDRLEEHAVRARAAGQRIAVLPAVEEHPAVRLPDLRPGL